MANDEIPLGDPHLPIGAGFRLSCGDKDGNDLCRLRHDFRGVHQRCTSAPLLAPEDSRLLMR